MLGGVDTTIATLRDAARVVRSVTTSTADEIRAIDQAIDALQAAKCERLSAMHEAREHEAEGASSIGTWARRELHQDAATTRHMVRAAATLRNLPNVAGAARAGLISFDHLRSFTYALKHLGVEETRLIEDALLDVAEHVAPGEFHAKVRQIRAVMHPDDLDEAWLKGMDKRDIRLARTAEGWHLTGFLDVEIGAKLNTILQKMSVPRQAGDGRAPSERRMDALDQICTTVLEHGLPSDHGVRPHINLPTTTRHLRSTRLPSPHRPQPPPRAVVQGRTHRPRQPHRPVPQMPHPHPHRTTPAHLRVATGPRRLNLNVHRCASAELRCLRWIPCLICCPVSCRALPLPRSP